MEVTQIAKELLSAMGFEVISIEEKKVEGRIKVDIRIRDARTLIGEKGATLAMFQHIVRRIASKKRSIQIREETTSADPLSLYGVEEFLKTNATSATTPPSIIDIDINRYKAMRENIMKDFAIDIAKTVREKRKSVELDPMPAFDRRIIHLALANFSGITTESMGEGERRCVVVRPQTVSKP